MSKRLVYIACPLGDGPDRELNRQRASKWVAWAAEQGVAPVCTWIVLTGQWSESRREEGLEIDCALVERCDEFWACGPKMSTGMHVEATHARKHNVPVYVLVNPMWVDGPPQKKSSFAELVRNPEPPTGKVVAHMRRMAHHHNIPYEDFILLSQVTVIALEMENPTPKQESCTRGPSLHPLSPSHEAREGRIDVHPSAQGGQTRRRRVGRGLRARALGGRAEVLAAEPHPERV